MATIVNIATNVCTTVRENKAGNSRKNVTLRCAGVGQWKSNSKGTGISVQALRVPRGLRLSDFMTMGI